MSSSAVYMTRRVTFSSGHRYWLPDLTPLENRGRFGNWASPYNHGHNYILDVTVCGEIDAVTGMVVNIKSIDELLQDRIVAQFDGRSINDEIPAFLDQPSSLENLASYIQSELRSGVFPVEATFFGLRLEETPLLWVETTCDENPIMTLTRVYEFAAAHRLHVPTLSEDQNLELFGKCNNLAGHGHNYVLEVSVEGEPDPATGMLVDINDMDRKVEELVVDRYDHRHLNVDLPEFAGRPPTSEIVAQEIFDRLSGRLTARLSRVRLHETARNIFEVRS